MTPRADRRAPGLVPAIAAVALVGAVIGAGVASGAFLGDDSSPSASGGGSTPVVGSTVPPPAITAPPTTAPIVKTNLSETLGDGSFGDEVAAVQTRLKELGFDPGPIDGQFGSLTRASVWAFEKLVMQTPRNEATGRVTNEMWQLMQEPLVILPRRPDAATPNHTEIYLPEQVIIFFRDDKPALITHMSSGTGEEWCEEVTISPGERGNEKGTEPLKRGECGNSKTPGGVFAFDRQRVGAWESALGTMWNPMYFNYGIAVHGAANVPLEPASHGCIRIPLTIGEYFQTLVTIGDQVFVFDGVKEPEEYSERDKMPIFNWLDPDYSTTTTTLPLATLPRAIPPSERTEPDAESEPQEQQEPNEPAQIDAPATETTSATVATN